MLDINYSGRWDHQISVCDILPILFECYTKYLTLISDNPVLAGGSDRLEDRFFEDIVGHLIVHSLEVEPLTKRYAEEATIRTG